MKKYLNTVLNLMLVNLFLMTFANSKSFAEDQVIDDQEIINVESLYKSQQQEATSAVNKASSLKKSNPNEATTEPVVSTVPTENGSANTPVVNTSEEKSPEPVKPEKIERLTDLNRLAPFREISVIQKKYLPKTERFQLFAAGGMTTNSPWFLNLGFKLGLGYNFTESFGIELTGTFLSNSEREVAKEIRENNNLQPEKFVNTKSYMGGDFVWTPIYGKVTFLNDRIIPFDMYFSAGVGQSTTNSQEGKNTTYHIGTGQIFALSKSVAFRWDYSWNMFQATPVPDTALTSTAAPASNTYNDLILTAGLSFFFPEVSNR